jgi:hypothetical protein
MDGKFVGVEYQNTAGTFLKRPALCTTHKLPRFECLKFMAFFILIFILRCNCILYTQAIDIMDKGKGKTRAAHKVDNTLS